MLGQLSSTDAAGWSLTQVARIPGMRVLCWAGEMLYASRGYELFCGPIVENKILWQTVGTYSPPFWRTLTNWNRLSARLARDGFHALNVLPSGHVVGAVPGAIVTKTPGASEFRTTHKVSRGTRPLHIAATPAGHLFFGEYFNNPNRDEVHIYASEDRGQTWQVAYTFPKATIRHVHNIVHDRFQNCLWIFTGDHGTECRIVRASCDLTTMDIALEGNQQARAVAAIPMTQGIFFSSDTPLEANYVYCLDPGGALAKIFPLASSSIYGCQVREMIFFSTMVEPSRVNQTQSVYLYGGQGAEAWRSTLEWRKDRWSPRLFQYGNAYLPDGENHTNFLAITTVAVDANDCVTAIYRVEHSGIKSARAS